MEVSDNNLLHNLLDPVLFIESFLRLESPDGMIRWDMDSYQKHLCRDNSRNRAINKSKKTGISTTIAGESIHKAFTMPGRQLIFVSCYDTETRAYTKNGLKSYAELLIGDEVLSLNVEANTIEWKPIEKINILPYSGSMISFKGKSTDLLVTPNHKMLIKTRNSNKKSEIKILEAQDCLKYKAVFNVMGNWNGINNETLTFGDKQYQTEDIFYLVGLYIGDGFLNYAKRKTGLSQKEFLKSPRDSLGHIIKNPNNKSSKVCCGMRLCIPESDKSCEKIISILNKMDIRCYRNRRYPDRIRFYEKQLINLFEECGQYAPNKKIPNWMLEYSKKYLDYLFQGLLDSDGNRIRVLCTTSLPLTTQCIELATKIGKRASFKKYPPKKDVYIGNRKVKNIRDHYILSFSRGEQKTVLSQDNIHDYNGIVWCPVVKDNHNLLVERNGKICFSGNTGQRIAEELLGKWNDLFVTIPEAMRPPLSPNNKQTAGLPNGVRIMSLPSSDPGNIRGFGMRGSESDVYLDEYAHVANDKDLWIVVRDFQIIGGRITLNSTPYGKRGKYFEIVEPLQAVYEHVAEPFKTTWSYHQIHFTDCPRLASQEKFLREGMNDIDFQQEYECRFIDESLAFFPYDIINPCQKVTEFVQDGYTTKNPILFGIDFGKTTSETIVWVVEKTAPETFKTLYIEEMAGVNYQEQADAIKMLKIMYDPISINVDASGPGGQTMEDILSGEKYCGPVIHGFDLSATFKENIIIRLRMLMQRKKLLIPSKEEGVLQNIAEKFERQLHGVQRTSTKMGLHTRYSGKEEAGMDDMVWACYDKETEVLTEDGFKFFKDITMNDLIATLNPNTNCLEYYKPFNLISYEYSGDMVHFKGKSIDLLVTPNHKMYVRKHYSGRIFKEFEFIEAKDLLNKHHKMKRNANWIGQEKEVYTIPSVNILRKHPSHSYIRAEKQIPMDLWLEFLGYYISEGHVSTNGISIYQSLYYNPDKVEVIRSCLKKMEEYGYSLKEHIREHLGRPMVTWNIYDKQLALHLITFGRNCWNKFIPKDIKCLNKEKLKIFFNALYLGDGATDGHVYYTSSPILKDDVMEIGLKLGLSVTEHIDKGELGITYCISFSKHNEPELNHHKKDQVSLESYDGMVYCAEVPNHLLFTRRCGKTVWSGNCALAVYEEFTYEFDPIIEFFPDKVLEKLQNQKAAPSVW